MNNNGIGNLYHMKKSTVVGAIDAAVFLANLNELLTLVVGEKYHVLYLVSLILISVCLSLQVNAVMMSGVAY
jgi:hypothetical protein